LTSRKGIIRIDIVLDDTLVEEVKRLSGARTKKGLISIAVWEFVATRKRLNLLDLAEKIHFREDYDYKGFRG
jgi:hypothetical protein